jgi:hypothetical protein
MSKRFVAALVSLFFAAAAAAAQPRAQADVKVRSISATLAGDRSTCRVEVHNDNDDDARRTTVRILLPVGVRFVSSARCTVAPTETSDRTEGLALCDIGHMRVGEAQTVEVTTTAPPDYVSPTFAAFAWSTTPDPAPRNNYGEATAVRAAPEPASARAEIDGYAPADCFRKGGAVTILGSGFGDEQGSRRAVLGGHGISVLLAVWRWSDGRIAATIPNDPRIRAGRSYYIGIQNGAGHWVSNINRSRVVCR